ncbi:MAG: COX15/CtaA family protein, partial [Planctomycetes bacterium]|nr:COX15/CtaA family protein [Planctomycetota bacterium]
TPVSARPATFHPWLHRFALLTAFTTLLLITAGGTVTSLGAGNSVPDWPTSYDRWVFFWVPKDWWGVPNILAEHGHRVLGATLGVEVLLLAIWYQRVEGRSWIRKLGWISLVAVTTQGILGGMTVLNYTPLWNSALHGTVGQSVFCLLIAMAVFTSRRWVEGAFKPPERPSGPLLCFSTVLTLLVFCQLILGATMRHMKGLAYKHPSEGDVAISPLAIQDFPLAMGRLIPPLEEAPVVVHFAHRCVALLILCLVVYGFVLVRRDFRQQRWAWLLVRVLLVLVLVQVTLGAFTVWSNKAIVTTVTHVVNGALVLATSFLTALTAFTLRAAERRTQRAVPVAGREVPA